MPTQLSGYYDNDASKQSALKEITITNVGNKAFLDTLPFFSQLSKRYENNSNGQPIYIGYADPGTAVDAVGWAITKATYDSNGLVTSELWATGNTQFDKTWDNRGTYIYT